MGVSKMLEFRDIEEEIYSIRNDGVEPTAELVRERLREKMNISSEEISQFIQIAIDSGDLIEENGGIRFPTQKERIEKAEEFCQLLGV